MWHQQRCKPDSRGDKEEGTEGTAAAEKPHTWEERATECYPEKALDQIFLPPIRQGSLGHVCRETSLRSRWSGKLKVRDQTWWGKPLQQGLSLTLCWALVLVLCLDLRMQESRLGKESCPQHKRKWSGQRRRVANSNAHRNVPNKANEQNTMGINSPHLGRRCTGGTSNYSKPASSCQNF